MPDESPTMPPAPRSTQSEPPEPGFPVEHPNRSREYHGRRTVFVGLLVVGAVALALWLGLRGHGGSASDEALIDLPAYLNPNGVAVERGVDALAPDFELTTLDGERFRLSDWRGHPLLLNFWASWCEPCRREVPVLVRLQEQYRDAGLIVVGINIEETAGPAQQFADEFGINYPIPMDFSSAVTRRYLQVGPPNSIFVRPDGAIDAIFIGQAPDATFEQQVADLVRLLPTPVGAAMLPGPKALPAALTLPDAPPEADPGALAPDFLLARLDAPEALWRLSDQRGRAVALVFIPPACVACEERAARVLALAQAAGADPVIVLSREQWQSDRPAFPALEWRADVAQIYRGAEVERLVLIDAGGVIDAVEATGIVTAATFSRIALTDSGKGPS